MLSHINKDFGILQTRLEDETHHRCFKVEWHQLHPQARNRQSLRASPGRINIFHGDKRHIRNGSTSVACNLLRHKKATTSSMVYRSSCSKFRLITHPSFQFSTNNHFKKLKTSYSRGSGLNWIIWSCTDCGSKGQTTRISQHKAGKDNIIEDKEVASVAMFAHVNISKNSNVNYTANTATIWMLSGTASPSKSRVQDAEESDHQGLLAIKKLT